MLKFDFKSINFSHLINIHVLAGRHFAGHKIPQHYCTQLSSWSDKLFPNSTCSRTRTINECLSSVFFHLQITKQNKALLVTYPNSKQLPKIIYQPPSFIFTFSFTLQLQNPSISSSAPNLTALIPLPFPTNFKINYLPSNLKLSTIKKTDLNRLSSSARQKSSTTTTKR